ncbi:class III lanthionine synthetase LanKC [Actinospica robiniae]|uniref:class III lanthionine synthetase LanKC n=1 Tax=Actinospica robiniae TaxID=304901 RepID=UPI00040D73CF|nr:class III lanthionine synthetase LanKC [Actinospica robiniae]
MDRRYEAYCLADPYFYDHPALREDLTPPFPQVRRPAPAGWSAGPNGDWWHVLPDGHGLPEQGWKIHVSATPQDAERVLDLVWETCAAARLPFKFLRSRGMLFLRNSKYAERGGSGKFVTVYPRDEDELERAVALLDQALAGTPGPYILSDLRVGAGPVYVRYGSFVPRRVLTETGESVPALAHPDGHLVPDRRTPVFSPPEWVTLPGFLTSHLAARADANLADLPYTVHKALHFSNGGGVYQATDTRSGREVVLKEGRPHAGLLADGRDAVARLEAERAVLERAAGTGAGPEVVEAFTLGEHRFLVLEYVPGKTLNNHFAERYPLAAADPDPEALRTYTTWALGIQAKVEAAVAALHERGIVFNDLHLFNIMVRPDDTVTLIDFEVAAFTEQARTQTLASRAFQAPKGTAGPAVDRYALACLRLALFLPLTALLPLDRARTTAMARTIAAEFPDVPAAFLDEAVAVITAGIPEAPDIPPFDPGAALAALDWPALRASLAAGILATATPEREDRLYPGDVAQFTGPGGGLGLAHGAAGVLYALHATGAPVPEEHIAWLAKRAGDLPKDTGVGLYGGALGIAVTLDVLGRADTADLLLEQALDERWQRIGPDLHDGLAGFGLGLTHFAARTGDAALLAAALEAGRLAAELLAQDAARDRRPEAPQRRAGLMHGASGPALLFVRLFEQTGDADWLTRAGAALRLDLARCVRNADGSLRVDEGWRALPYLADGSAGIGLAARRLLAHREEADLAAAVADIDRASNSRFYAQAGLFHGRAGLVLALAAADPAARPTDGPGSGGTGLAAPTAAGVSAPSAATDAPRRPASATTDAAPPAAGTGPWPRRRGGGPGPAVAGQARRLAWHAVAHDAALSFPGDQLHRLSTDLATGAAGVLLALGAALHTAPVALPLAEPASAPPRAAR